MEDGEYEKYKRRSEFFNATGRTVDGLHGQMFRKDIVIICPETLKKYLENVDGKGSTFAQFCSEVSYQSLQTSWGGIFLDAPKVNGIISKAEGVEKGIYPFLSYVCETNLINWHYETIERVKKLTRVSIHTRKEYPTSDPFEYTEKDEYKLLYLDENGNYSQQIRVDGEDVGEVIQPTKDNRFMDFIPFYPLPNTDPEKPIILDLVNENLSWYRKSADLENGGHWTGVPTPYILGYEPELKYDSEGNKLPKDPIYLGGSSILCLPEGSHIGYLEFQGSGLGQLRTMMMDDEDRMAILGARIISAEKRGVEAVDTAKIHRAGENSVLQAFANNLSVVFTKVLRDYLEWIVEAPITEEISVKVNTDYDVTRMEASEVASLVSCWQSGGISKRILFNNLQEGEVVPNDISFEEMEEEIAVEREQSLQNTIETQTALQNANLDNEE